MHFHFSFYSSLLLIFFTNGVLFALLLLRKAVREEDRAAGWMAAFAACCTLNIVPWMLGHAGWYSVQPYRDILFYIPFQHFFLLGPLIYWYTKTLLNPGVRFQRRDWLHFVPALLYLAYSLVMFVTDKLVLRRPWFYADGHDRDLDNWYRIAGILSFSVYLLLCLRYYRLYRRVAVQVVSFADALLLHWMKRYLVALLLMQAADILFFFLYPGWGSFTAKWWYYFCFSALAYYVAFSAYTNPARPLFSFRMPAGGDPLLLRSAPKLLVYLSGTHREADALLLETAGDAAGPEGLEEELLPWKERVRAVMEEEQAYREPELTLGALAARLATNVSLLSKVINRGFGLGFNDFVNGYRVAAIKAGLAAGEHHRQTLLGLSIDCGFNSKTTFNRVFRKHTGLSPREYLQQRDREPENVTVKAGKEVPKHDSGRPGASEPSPSAEISGI